MRSELKFSHTLRINYWQSGQSSYRLSAKNEPFLYIGLDDRSYEILKKTVGIKKASQIYLSFLRMFSLHVYNLDLENCDELRRLLENQKGQIRF